MLGAADPEAESATPMPGAEVARPKRGHLTVTLWHVSLDMALEDVGTAQRLLPADLAKRAEGFRRPEHRCRFILRHAAYSRILSEAYAIPLEKLQFSRDPNGKPFIPGHPAFNASSSGDLAVLAIASEGEVGVDVEELRDFPLSEEILKLAATREERKLLSDLAPSERLPVFLRLWVRKEAVLKALGVGLNRPPSDFSILDSGIHWDLQTRSRWRVRDISSIGRHHVASLACEDADNFEVVHHRVCS